GGRRFGLEPIKSDPLGRDRGPGPAPAGGLSRGPVEARVQAPPQGRRSVGGSVPTSANSARGPAVDGKLTEPLVRAQRRRYVRGPVCLRHVLPPPCRLTSFSCRCTRSARASTSARSLPSLVDFAVSTRWTPAATRGVRVAHSLPRPPQTRPAPGR